jgi:hypothetical protein
MIFEDVHWLDPTSLEVVGRTVDRLKTLAALVIVTHRPEFEPPWIGLCYLPEHQPLRRVRLYDGNGDRFGAGGYHGYTKVTGAQ